MKEDKLALVKAVDSGDTDLGKERYITVSQYRQLMLLVFSISCSIAPA